MNFRKLVHILDKSPLDKHIHIPEGCDIDSVELEGMVCDSRKAAPGLMFAAAKGDHADGYNFIEQAVAKGAPAVLCERESAAPVPQIITPDVRSAMGYVCSMIHDEPSRRMTMIAVTGTNGKTTITSLLYEMVKRKGKGEVAGNIGYPLCELASRYGNQEKDVALELSNFQLLGIETFRPTVSVVCNLAPDHLDYMDSVEAYYESKMRIYENCRADDWFLRNVDDPLIMKYARNIPCKVIDFSLTRTDVDLYRKDGKVWLHDTMLFSIDTLKIVGDYNVSNAMIAACMAYRLGVSLEDIQSVCAQFTSVEHRLEFIGERDGIRFYNDSKATNTHAVAAALSSFSSNIILLAGGHDKGIPFDDLKRFDERVKLCVSFGETKELFRPIFTNCICRDTMKQALDEACLHAKSGDVILLSPACSSFDQFKNYEERGRIFKDMVHEILAKGA